MNKQHNSWLEWIKVCYANSLNDQLVRYVAKTTFFNNDTYKVLNKISDDFHHGIVPENRRMENPML